MSVPPPIPAISSTVPPPIPAISSTVPPPIQSHPTFGSSSAHPPIPESFAPIHATTSSTVPPPVPLACTSKLLPESNFAKIPPQIPITVPPPLPVQHSSSEPQHDTLYQSQVPPPLPLTVPPPIPQACYGEIPSPISSTSSSPVPPHLPDTHPIPIPTGLSHSSDPPSTSSGEPSASSQSFSPPLFSALSTTNPSLIPSSIHVPSISTSVPVNPSPQVSPTAPPRKPPKPPRLSKAPLDHVISLDDNSSPRTPPIGAVNATIDLPLHSVASGSSTNTPTNQSLPVSLENAEIHSVIPENHNVHPAPAPPPPPPPPPPVTHKNNTKTTFPPPPPPHISVIPSLQSMNNMTGARPGNAPPAPAQQHQQQRCKLFSCTSIIHTDIL